MLSVWQHLLTVASLNDLKTMESLRFLVPPNPPNVNHVVFAVLQLRILVIII